MFLSSSDPSEVVSVEANLLGSGINRGVQMEKWGFWNRIKDDRALIFIDSLVSAFGEIKYRKKWKLFVWLHLACKKAKGRVLGEFPINPDAFDGRGGARFIASIFVVFS
ncbi:hypothetical protein AgCh_037167 [Apium graveolens]